MIDGFFYAALFIIPILLLLGLLFVAYQLFKGLIFPLARTFIKLFRFPPKPPAHWAVWLAAAVLAYVLFPALYTDFFVAGARISRNHDVIALRAWNRTLFWGILFAANVPLLLLFQFKISRHNIWLGLSWRLWQALFITFVCATCFGIFAHIQGQGAFFSSVWFWWRDMAVYMDAYNAKTVAELARPERLFDEIWLKDFFCMALAFLPFLLLYRASWPLQGQPLPAKHRPRTQGLTQRPIATQPPPGAPKL